MAMEHNTFRLPVGTDNSSDQLFAVGEQKPQTRGPTTAHAAVRTRAPTDCERGRIK